MQLLILAWDTCFWHQSPHMTVVPIPGTTYHRSKLTIFVTELPNQHWWITSPHMFKWESPCGNLMASRHNILCQNLPSSGISWYFTPVKLVTYYLFDIHRTKHLSGEASHLFVLNLNPLGFGHLPCCPQLDFIVELCRIALDENPHSFGASPHSSLGWRSQLRIRNK